MIIHYQVHGLISDFRFGLRVVSSQKFPRTWDLGLSEGRCDENMWRHIFGTKRHIPGSQNRCQVSKTFFLVLPKMWRFSWNFVQMWRFRHIVTSLFWAWNLVRKPCQVLGSGFQVFQFRIGTILNLWTWTLRKNKKTKKKVLVPIGWFHFYFIPVPKQIRLYHPTWYISRTGWSVFRSARR